MVAQKTHTALTNIENQQKWFNGTTLFVIVVSFVHMFYSISAFSADALHDRAAAFLITGAIDLVTWRVSEYIVYARGRGKVISWPVWTLFYFSLTISFILNLTYLVSHLPAQLWQPLAILFAILLALFVPFVIGVLPMIVARLENDAAEIKDSALESEGTAGVQGMSKEELIDRLIDVGLSDNAIYGVVKGKREKALGTIKERRGLKSGTAEVQPGESGE